MKNFYRINILLLAILGLTACGGGGGSSSSGPGVTDASQIPSESKPSTESNPSDPNNPNNPNESNTPNQPVSSDNPYTGSFMYVNPDYQSEVNTFLAANPGYKNQASRYLDNKGSWNVSTSVWIDRESAIYGYGNIHGVAWHLQQALQQSTSTSKPVVVSFVVYDLPNRDCDAYSSNGEIKINPSTDPQGNNALAEYNSNYIDPFNAAINSFYTSNPSAVNKVKVVLLIEPDSIPNMITNSNNSGCQLVAQNHVYERGIAYALKQFNSGASTGSVYMYIDIAHSGWLGWANNANQIYKYYNNNEPSVSSNVSGLGAGFDKLRGFVVNTSNYTPLSEAFQYADYLANNNAIISSNFYGWNDAYSLDSYVAEIMSLNSGSGALTMGGGGHQIQPPSSALYKNMHFLIDTSRNGWTPHQFTDTPGTATYSRNDLRTTNANWCNVQNIVLAGTTVSPGFGKLPQADPVLANPLYAGTLPIDAYIWVKPPGESDGNYNSTTGSGDKMCGRGTGGDHNGNMATDSLQNGSSPAPAAGQWFDKAFIQLLTNANS